MTRLYTALTLLFLGHLASADANIQSVAEEVLHKLYQAHGHQTISIPAVAIIDDDSFGASYNKRTNTIKIGTKLFAICSSFGPDSLSALAFVLGHELAHAHQHELEAYATSFIAREYVHDDGEQVEESADVQGLFMAYLAGYGNAGAILPELISRIYNAYSLSSKIYGYPDISERQETTQKTIARATELIRLHEAGIYLMAMGQYELAAACFKHIQTEYQGREIFNNLGLCYALAALNFTERSVSPYVFPFEISWQTRMRNVRSGTLDREELAQMHTYLQEAENYLQIASKLDSGLLATDINLMCVMMLGGRPEEALARGLLKGNKAQGEELQKLQLALALAYSHTGKHEQATALWQGLEHSGGLIAAQAGFNREVIMGNSLSPLDKDANCPELPGMDEVIDGLILHRPDLSGAALSLLPDADIKLYYTETPNSRVYHFIDAHRLVSLQQALRPIPAGILSEQVQERIFTENGNIWHCKAAQICLKFDTDGTLTEWVKYIVTRR